MGSVSCRDFSNCVAVWCYIGFEREFSERCDSKFCWFSHAAVHVEFPVFSFCQRRRKPSTSWRTASAGLLDLLVWYLLRSGEHCWKKYFFLLRKCFTDYSWAKLYCSTDLQIHRGWTFHSYSLVGNRKPTPSSYHLFPHLLTFCGQLWHTEKKWRGDKKRGDTLASGIIHFLTLNTFLRSLSFLAFFCTSRLGLSPPPLDHHPCSLFTDVKVSEALISIQHVPLRAHRDRDPTPRPTRWTSEWLMAFPPHSCAALNLMAAPVLTLQLIAFSPILSAIDQFCFSPHKQLTFDRVLSTQPKRDPLWKK